jgi:hypothetical protein
MSNLRKPFTIPPARLVGGSLVEAKTMDAENKPLVYKSGPNAGKPRATFDFAAAIPKAAQSIDSNNQVVAGQPHWAFKPADWDTNPATAGLKILGCRHLGRGLRRVPPGSVQPPRLRVQDH